MRRKKAEKREHKPDTVYQNVALSRFVNYIMEGGKKSTAEKVVYAALTEVEKQTKEKAIEVFEKAIDNVSPRVEVASRRIGGANYQVPREVRPERKFMLASRWIIDAARSKKGKPMAQRLADEIVAAYKNEGTAIKKKQDIHRMAESNRAFAHFSW
ncbi:MAG: 30S ribosomal protein S7 [Patescibacteria group bacterium]|jgi:small subunit ribosomal protein S7|nr:30S ribosomal protein S7 [Patescibacteria group bacterium]